MTDGPGRRHWEGKGEKGRGKESQMKRGKGGVDRYRSRICRVASEEEECEAGGERVKTTSRKATTRGGGGGGTIRLGSERQSPFWISLGRDPEVHRD